MKNALNIIKVPSQLGVRFLGVKKHAYCFQTELLPTIVDWGPSNFTKLMWKEGLYKIKVIAVFSNFYSIAIQ